MQQAKKGELLELKRQKVTFLSECSKCTKDKSPFHSVDNMDIACLLIHNSHVNAKKQTLYQGLKSIFLTTKYKVDSGKTDKPNSSHTDYSDMMTDGFILQPKFKFYQTHEFHRFVNNLPGNKGFIFFHRSICCLQANFGNLIYDLDHQFSVVTLSETWTPQSV